MSPLAAIKLPEGTTVPVPGLPEGLAGDAFAELLGTLEGGPPLEPATLDGTPPVAEQPADNPLAQLAVLVAAIKTLAVPHKAAAGEPADEDGAEADRDGTRPGPDGEQPAAISVSLPLPAIEPAAAMPGPTAATPAPIPQALEPVSTAALPVAGQAEAAEAPEQPRQDRSAPVPAQPGPARASSQADPFRGLIAGIVQPRDSDDTPPPAVPDKIVPPAPAEKPVGAILAPPPPLPASAAAATVPAEAVDHSVSQYLDLAQQSEWLDQLAGEIARTAGKSGILRFRLHPESLGRLNVEMSQGAAGASIRLTADTEAARAIIADAQPRLIAEARAQGVRIAETHVGLGTSGQWSSAEQHGQRGGNPEWFLRTSGADRGEEAASARPNPGAAERYA